MSGFEMPHNVDFYTLLAQTAEDEKEGVILGIIQAAKEGDGTAIKFLEKALTSSQFSEEERIKLSERQLQDIIILAAARFGAAQSAPSGI